MSPPCATAYIPRFFFQSPETTRLYTLSLHDALPISEAHTQNTLEKTRLLFEGGKIYQEKLDDAEHRSRVFRSEEHTSELQSHVNLVCRLLLEKKKKTH